MDEVLEKELDFKKTKIGLIPNNWSVVKIGDIADVMGGKRLPKGSFLSNNVTPHPYIRVTNMYVGGVSMKDIKYVPTEVFPSIKRYRIWKDDLFISVAGTLGVAGKIPLELDGANLTENADKITNIKCDKDYLLLVLMSQIVQKHIELEKTTAAQPKLALTRIKSFTFPLPTSKEQQKIVAIFFTLDKTIEHTRDLIKQLKIRKEGLMQQILTGKTRLKGFGNDWIVMKLGDYLKERKETNYIDLPLLSVGKNGVYPQNEDRKDNSNEDKSKYKRICVDDIGYNTMRMWQGRSALSDLEGIVSPAYTIVTPKENASSLFFSYLFQQDEMVHKFYRHSQGMVSDTWMCKFKDLSTIKFYAPDSLEEQIAVANVLEASTNEIKKLESCLNELQNQKKGLMQQLLTGQKRVSVN